MLRTVPWGPLLERKLSSNIYSVFFLLLFCFFSPSFPRSFVSSELLPPGNYVDQIRFFFKDKYFEALIAISLTLHDNSFAKKKKLVSFSLFILYLWRRNFNTDFTLLPSKTEFSRNRDTIPSVLLELFIGIQTRFCCFRNRYFGF